MILFFQEYLRAATVNQLSKSRDTSIVLVSEMDEWRQQWQILYRKKINKTIANQYLRKFYHSMIGGAGFLGFRTKKLFLYYGILHIAVISGLHISLLYGTAVYSLTLPFRLLYALGPLSFPQLESITVVSHKLAMVIVISYGWLCGFSPPCQRAVIFIFLSQFFAIVVPLRVHILDRIKYALLLQLLLFPMSFFTFSNFLSWSITGIILSQNHRKGLLGILHIQLYIVIFTTLIFPSVSLIGFFANVLGTLLFTPLIITMFWGALGIAIGYDMETIVNYQEHIFNLLQFVREEFAPIEISFRSGRSSLLLSVLLLGIILLDLSRVLRYVPSRLYGGQGNAKDFNRR